MGFSDEDKILIKNLHDSAGESLWYFFNDTPSTACELAMLISSLSVTFSETYLTVASLFTKLCRSTLTDFEFGSKFYGILGRG